MPSSSSIATAPGRVTRTTCRWSRTSTPPSSSASSTWAPANGSSRSISRSPRWTSVTFEPKADHAWAISTPTTPPPRIASRAGTSFAVVASMFVHGRASCRPSMSGISALDPVATITAFRATSSSPSAAPPSTTTRRSPSSRPRPRTSVTPCSSSHGSWPESSRFEITSSRRASTAGTSIGPIESPATRSTSRRSSTGRSSAFEGMQA